MVPIKNVYGACAKQQALPSSSGLYSVLVERGGEWLWEKGGEGEVKLQARRVKLDVPRALEWGLERQA